ncbi:uncharacterized protein TA09170 [Theileria annulata]|uniref:Uncharacterized protein n=1 Tax=Theileria annulata TaxID=5874 RepID=Q4UAH3_THEAN|nr:uncharacterized protein TA09170 [Theileria annulata]CAI76178.1 hypothetical protein TA09170 [Theileria annulata]|eukprot:XP_952803.1 hypothetical protein TA09170 [Theileria annulata]
MDEKLINLINKKFRSNLRTKCFINISKDSINSKESNHPENSIDSKESNNHNSIDSKELNHKNSIDSRETNNKITNSKRFIVLLLNNDNSLILLHLMIQRNLSRHSPSKSYYSNTTNSTTNIPGRGANSTAIECTTSNNKDTGKGANFTGMECISEKILNEIAVVTKTGESSNNIERVSTNDINGSKEAPIRAGTEESGAVGASTVTVDIKNMLESDDLILNTIINVQESSYDFIKNSNELIESVISILNKFTAVIITHKSESLTICSYKLNNYLTIININFCYFLHSEILNTRVCEECHEKCHELRENYKKLKKNPDLSTIIWNKLLYHNINKYFKSFSNNIYLLLSDCVEDICKITLLLTCLGLSESIINSTSYTNIINTSVTVTGTTASNGPEVSTSTEDSSKDSGTIGASTVTEGKGANSTLMECTMGKGANSMGLKCTSGKGANSMTIECTNIVNGIIVLRPLKTITQEQLLFYSKFYNIQNTKIQSNTVNRNNTVNSINDKMSITKCINDLISELTIQHNNSLYNIVNITNKLSNPNIQDVNEEEEEKENEEDHSDEEEKKEFEINLKNYKQNPVNGYTNKVVDKDVDKDVLKYFNEL